MTCVVDDRRVLGPNLERTDREQGYQVQVPVFVPKFQMGR